MDDQTTKLTITHHVAGQGGRYVAVFVGAPEGTADEGYLEWEPGGQRDGREVRVATHTVVPRAIGGRGVAGALVERLIEDAARQDFLIRPDCSYVARKFADNPGWASLKA